MPFVDGIKFEAQFWGSMNVCVSGDVLWGDDMEHNTFAIC